MVPELFIEGALASQLVPVASPALFFAMRGFGSPDMTHAAVACASGGVAGVMVTWMLGQILVYARKKEQIYISEEVYARARKWASTWLLPLLCFTWVQFGSMVPLAFSFLRVPLPRFLAAVAVGQFGYYLFWATH